jgi:hypothetical protein
MELVYALLFAVGVLVVLFCLDIWHGLKRRRRESMAKRQQELAVAEAKKVRYCIKIMQGGEQVDKYDPVRNVEFDPDNCAVIRFSHDEEGVLQATLVLADNDRAYISVNS